MLHFALLNRHGVHPRVHVALIASLLAVCSGGISAQLKPNPTPAARAVPLVPSGAPSKWPAGKPASPSVAGDVSTLVVWLHHRRAVPSGIAPWSGAFPKT